MPNLEEPVWGELSARIKPGRLLGASRPMRELFRLIAQVSRSRCPVLISGESGTGKELVARCIHESGPLAGRAFLPVDCGALAPTLIESELFGHVRGAFTGAVRTRQGLLEAAHGGTVFLDEIADLPMDLQAKLLRALQEKEIRPVGSTRVTRIEARVIAATNRDLEAAVQEGRFRKDLYFRLNVARLALPPLRERKDDIPLLANHFLEGLQAPEGPRFMLSDEGMSSLISYNWPGNVRELENSIERAVVFAKGPIFGRADLLLGRPERPEYFVAEPGAREVLPLREVEKIAILRALVNARGNKRVAAKMLRIGKTTLYRKLKEYRLHQELGIALDERPPMTSAS